jgi:hypothetical protein
MEARELGLKTSKELPTEIFELIQLCPRANQRRPSVEYIQLPYGPAARRDRRPSAIAISGKE